MKRRRSGYTLIEILVVVTILAILAGIVGTNLFNRKQEADQDLTRVQLAELKKSLQLYRLRFHRFPSAGEGLAALVKPPTGAPIIDAVPKDAWDADLRLDVAPDGMSAKVCSSGANGAAGDADDLCE